MAFTAPPQFPNLHDDWPLVRAAVENAGLDGEVVVWSDPAVDWSSFDLIVANGAWDNIHHVDEFLAWVDARARSSVPTVNSPATLRWNIDKHYLLDLERAGVPTVPTQWVEPGTADADVASLTLREGEVVVKPSVSTAYKLAYRGAEVYAPTHSGVVLVRVNKPKTATALSITESQTTIVKGSSDAISGSLTPFWSETTNPSGASRGTISPSASAVCCDLTASSTVPSPAGSSSGVTATAATVNSSTGPSTARPLSFSAATCAGSASQKSTE